MELESSFAFRPVNTEKPGFADYGKFFIGSGYGTETKTANFSDFHFDFDMEL